MDEMLLPIQFRVESVRWIFWMSGLEVDGLEIKLSDDSESMRRMYLM